ncbi:MAG: LptF/LptG family permease, partial [Rickettsiales bacterium]|nr:LptF/LptG family permease [Rickettsiales bacterium]
VMLAIPLALIGGNRGGRAYGLGVGLVVLVLYQKILGFGQALAASGKLSPFVSLWGPWLLLLIAALLLLAYRNYFPKSATLFSTKHPPL